MNYYKILINSNYIGVATTNDFRRYQTKHSIIIISDKNSVQYIAHDEVLYHDNWMRPINSDDYTYEIANVIEIDEEEYTILKNAEENNNVVVPEMNAKKSQKQSEDVDVNQLSYVKEAKINKLRADCQNAIVSGFDLELSDGEMHHFSMELTDQMEISRLVANGNTGNVPYHADGEKYKYYSFADILNIYNTMNDWKLYNTSYFSDLKNYINALRSINKIDGIKYGDKIPKKYQSEVYKDIKDKMDF